MEFEVPEALKKAQLDLVEKVKKSKGKIKIGINEVTKAAERETAKLVLIAKDTDPKEIVMHIPLICKEKNIPFSFADSKKDLGKSAGIQVGTTAIAITEEGGVKKEVDELAKKLKELK